MKPTPFNSQTDLAPIPFTKETCQAAKLMKEKGLNWTPHVGCFVWDEKQIIQVSSPFPNRIYFILNLGHFLNRFETIDNMAEKLVWLPTWHQTRQICLQLNIPDDKVALVFQQSQLENPGNELLNMYKLIADHL